MNRGVLEVLHSEGGVVVRREHPELAAILERLAVQGEMTAILPGVYVPAAVSKDWRARAAAVCRWDCDAVVVRDAAAALTFWPEITPDVVEVGNRRAQFTRAGLSFSRRRIPPELVITRGALRLSAVALTAIDLIDLHGGDVIDRALRSRSTSLAAMRDALGLTCSRPGNRHRRRMLLDSRDEPWSAAERLAHRVFRAAGLTGWQTNVPVRCGDRRYFLDVVFREARLVVEIDGRIHLLPDAFESDRQRGNDLLLAGWRVIHVTWRMLVDEPERVVAMIRRALRDARR